MEFGLIGASLSHSYSVPIHAKLRDYAYELRSLPPEEFEALLCSRAFRGLNITIPYKQRALVLCDSLSEAARRIGCVNTVVPRADGSLYGDNTDYPGFLYMTDRAGIRFQNRKVVILGSGGTSLTAQAAARDRGAAEVAVVSRSGAYHYGNLAALRDYDLLINTTPLGMYPHSGEAPVSLSGFPNCGGVIDVIYNPLRTKLLQEAEQRGIPNTNGLPMLVAQAKYASDLFVDTVGEGLVSSRFSEDAQVARVLTEMKTELTNIVLIGMPGSGKSTLGRLLAQRLGRVCLDTDALVAARAKLSIPEIFAQWGETAFRELEAAELADNAQRTGLVLSSGGGAVLREENRLALRQNGFVVWLRRDLEQLETAGRPLSTDIQSLQRLYAEREPLYRDCCDFICDIDEKKTPPEAAEQVLEGFYETVGH